MNNRSLIPIVVDAAECYTLLEAYLIDELNRRIEELRHFVMGTSVRVAVSNDQPPHSNPRIIVE